MAGWQTDTVKMERPPVEGERREKSQCVVGYTFNNNIE